MTKNQIVRRILWLEKVKSRTLAEENQIWHELRWLRALLREEKR